MRLQNLIDEIEYIELVNFEDTYEEFMEENKLLDSLISDIKDLDLSPLEKYIYVLVVLLLEACIILIILRY